MRKIISLILSLLLLNQSVLVYAQGLTSMSNENKRPNIEFFSIPRLSEVEIAKQCQFKFNRKICEQYYKYGIDRQKAWNVYDRAFWNNQGEYWQLSPSELYDKYEQVAEGIGLLWTINPEYIDMKRGERISKIIIAWDITVIALLAGTVVAPILEAHGFHMAAQIAALVPNTSAVGGAIGERSIRAILKTLLEKLTTGHFWADLGLSFAYMIVDGLFVEGAFYMFRQTAKELDSLQETVNSQYAVKHRNLLNEIINPDLTKEEKEELENNQKEIYNLKTEVKEALKQALEKGGWGDDPYIHREAVITLYALEYIRAEMADVSDSHRYREASVDIAQVYFSGELTQLIEDRYELWKEINDAYNAKLEEDRERAKKIAERLDGPVLNLSGGTPYFRAGHI